jgi:ferritin-like protein
MPNPPLRRLSVSNVSVEVTDDDATGAAASERGDRASRATLLKKATAAGGTVALGGVLVGTLPSFAAAKPSARQDRQILDFLLELEQLQAAFYAEARSRGALDGELRQFADVVGAHERAHVAFLEKRLGRPARAAARRRDFGHTTTDAKRFVVAAAALEDAVVAAYNGQGPNLTRAGLAAVATIASVEARHAAWIRAIAKEIPAPAPNDALKTERQTLGTLKRTGLLDRREATR